MLKYKDLSLLYESAVMLVEYSEPFIQKLIQQYKPQAGGNIDENQIRYMITRFDQLKTNPVPQARIKEFAKEHFPKIKNPLQVELYSWHELEQLIDQFPDPSVKKAIKANKGKTLSEMETGAKPVYVDDKVEIYRADSANDCIKFKDYVSKKLAASGQRTGNTNSFFGWCIAWAADRNLYARYRFDNGGVKATVYFVIDNTRPITDSRHVQVVMKLSDGRHFQVTSSLNDGDRHMTWDQLVQQTPVLAGHEGLFKITGMTEDEQIFTAIRGATAEDFAGFGYKAKIAYMDSKGDDGNPKQIFSTDYLKSPPEIQHRYIAVRNALPKGEADSQLIFLFPDAIEASAKKIENIKRAFDEKNIQLALEDEILAKGSKQAYEYYKVCLLRAISDE